MNAASFIAEGLTAMNRAAAPKASTAYASRSVVETMQRTEQAIRAYALSGRALADEPKMTAWADELRTAINEAKGLK